MASPQSDSRSDSAESARSLHVELGGSEEPADRVPIELTTLGGVAEDVIHFYVDPDASIGQVISRFANAALQKFHSGDFFDTYKNGSIVLINEGSSCTQFHFSDPYTFFLKTKEIRDLRRKHGNVPLLFQLLRCSGDR